MHPIVIKQIVGLCLILVLSGCSSTQTAVLDMGGEDGSKIATTIEDLNEVKHNSKKVVDFFVAKGGAPDVKKFNHMSFYVVGKPVVSGTTATCKVLIENVNGTPLGEQEWQFEKVSDRWKIKAAPTP